MCGVVAAGVPSPKRTAPLALDRSFRGFRPAMFGPTARYRSSHPVQPGITYSRVRGIATTPRIDGGAVLLPAACGCAFALARRSGADRPFPIDGVCRFRSRLSCCLASHSGWRWQVRQVVCSLNWLSDLRLRHLGHRRFGLPFPGRGGWKFRPRRLASR